MHLLLLCLGLFACSDMEPERLAAAPGPTPVLDAGSADDAGSTDDGAPADDGASPDPDVEAPGDVEERSGGAPPKSTPPARSTRSKKRSARAASKSAGDPGGRPPGAAPAPPPPKPTPAPEPKPTPEPQPTHEADVADPAEAWLATLRDSAITYNRPETVPFGQVFDVQFFIDISGDTAATEAALDAAREANDHITGDTHTALVPTGNEVEVSLLGSNADIDALEPDRQRLSASTQGRWQWRITPTSPDDIVLKLHVLAIQPGHASGLRIQSYEDSIVVKVTTTQKAQIWLSDNWEWAWTFFVAPIGGFLWARFRRRKTAKAPPSGDGEA
jgi:hypothetical protein